MTLFDIVALALLQGVTEFLPISSSGHLALWPLLTGRSDQGASMDVAVHLGTLAAVCLYFRSDVGRLLVGSADIATGRVRTPDARMVWLLALATVPAVVVGLGLKLADAQAMLRSLEVIGWATLVGGVLLWLADRTAAARAAAERWSTRDALLMGLAQATALVPGVSRSGITMTMARLLGFDRTQSARLALLMAVPVILAAGAAEVADVALRGDLVLGGEMVIGALLSFAAALAALFVMMRMFASEWTMLPFVVYRLALGSFLLALVYA